MLALGAATEPLDRGILGTAGGFGWWYGDLLDDDGTGLVLIAAYGLPFLPGLAGAARSGHPQLPSSRPSLNVCLYERGRPSLYLLQELEPDEAPWLEDGGEGCRMGETTVRSTLRAGRRALDVRVDCALPGTAERLVGTVHIEGAAARVDGQVGESVHEWTPLALGATGTAHLEIGGRTILDLQGRGYHDRNECPVPLDDLGIDHWLWGRVPDGDTEHVFYLLWPTGGGEPLAFVLHAGPDGRVRKEQVRVSLQRWRPSRYGLSWWRRIVLELDGGGVLDIDVERIVDNGPFYQRFLIRGGGAPGFAERVVPSRIDRPLFRPFVEMCVHRPGRASSFLAPWFLGARNGRLGRLLSSWVQRPALGST